MRAFPHPGIEQEVVVLQVIYYGSYMVDSQQVNNVARYVNTHDSTTYVSCNNLLCGIVLVVWY